MIKTPHRATVTEHFLKTATFRFLILLCSFTILTGCASAPPAESYQASSVAAMEDPYATDDLLRIGDYLVIRLSGVPDPEQGTFETRVDEGGQVSMPHIGSIPAAGLTTVQLKQKIETLYKMQKIFSNPNVTVISQQARYVSVTGEVRAPQRLFHTKDLTALSAIASCGGFTDYANRKRVRILRKGTLIYFNASEALSDPGKDIPLFPDDKIQVDRSVF